MPAQVPAANAAKEPLTPEETKLLISLLGRLSPGVYPLAVFNALKELSRWTAVEVILYRIRHNSLSVWLQIRDRSDLFWGESWHTAGKMVILSDQMPSDTISRLHSGEHREVTYLNPPIFFGPWFQDTLNGPQVELPYYTRTDDSHPGHGRFWPIDRLPKKIMAQNLVLYANWTSFVLANPPEDLSFSFDVRQQLSLARIRLIKRAIKAGYSDQLLY